MKTRELTQLSLLVAIAVIASRLNIDNPMLGSSSRFGFSFVVFLSGLWFGPWKGGLIGLVSNLLAFVLFDAGIGPFHIGFSLNAFLAGFIPGLYFSWIKKKKITDNFSKYSVLLMGLVSMGVIVYAWKAAYSPGIKAIMMFLVIFMNLAMVFAICKKTPVKDAEIISFDKVLFISFVYKFINSVLLAPLWLTQLFGRSYAFYFPIRLSKFPIETLLVAFVVYGVNRKMDKRIFNEWS
jgi:ECF transporter S component (folate family)